MVSKVKVRLGVTGAIALALLLGACAPSDSSSIPTPTVNAPVPTEGAEATPEDGAAITGDGERVPSGNVGQPVLSNVLIRDCQRTAPSGGFENVGLAVGETAIDFTLKDVDGNTVSLASLLGEKPVVMIFGSFT